MLRLLTLNLRADANRWEERFPMIINALTQANADIIGLQEVRLSIEQHILIANALNQSSQDNYSHHLCMDWYEPHILANAFLTRIPIIEHERLELPDGYRTAQRILIDVNNQQINIVNTHLHHKPYRDETIRLRQIQTIFEWIARFNKPFVLMGDLNARPDSETIQFAKTKLQSAYEIFHGCEPDSTFPTPLRLDENLSSRTIDYILCDKGFQIKNCQLIGTQAHPIDDSLYLSDHFGLVADIMCNH